MKNLKTLLPLVFLFSFLVIHGQTVGGTKSSPPLTDPLTNCNLRYYYYPNLEAYFDTKKNLYIFTENGQWTTAEEIPSGYRGYSLYNKVSVFITDYDEDDITQFIKVHKKKFPYNMRGKYKESRATAHID